MYLEYALVDCYPVFLVVAVVAAWIGYLIGRYIGCNPRRR